MGEGPGHEGTHISQDLVGGSLAIDTLPANETRIVVSGDPPSGIHPWEGGIWSQRGRIQPVPDCWELFPGWAGRCWL